MSHHFRSTATHPYTTLIFYWGPSSGELLHTRGPRGDAADTVPFKHDELVQEWVADVIWWMIRWAHMFCAPKALWYHFFDSMTAAAHVGARTLRSLRKQFLFCSLLEMVTVIFNRCRLYVEGGICSRRQFHRREIRRIKNERKDTVNMLCMKSEHCIGDLV